MVCAFRRVVAWVVASEDGPQARLLQGIDLYGKGSVLAMILCMMFQAESRL